MSTVTTTLSLVGQSAARAGVELPKALNDDLASIPTYSPQADPEALAAAVLDALDNNRDPAGDAKVKTELVRFQLGYHNVGMLLAAHLEQRRLDVLTRHAPGILQALADRLAEVDATLSEARAVLPGTDLADPEAVMGLRPDALQHWGRARDAAAVVGHVEQAARTLLRDTGLASVPGGPRGLLLLAADLAPDDVARLAGKVDRLTASGHQLSLATTSEEIERRLDAIEEQAEAAELEADRRFRAQARSAPGAVVRA